MLEFVSPLGDDCDDDDDDDKCLQNIWWLTPPLLQPGWPWTQGRRGGSGRDGTEWIEARRRRGARQVGFRRCRWKKKRANSFLCFTKLQNFNKELVHFLLFIQTDRKLECCLTLYFAYRPVPCSVSERSSSYLLAF